MTDQAADRDPCGQTARYFDGELAGPEDEAAAIEHLASCTRCQEELGDLMGVDVALQQQRAATPTSRAAASAPSRRRGVVLAFGGVALLAAAAGLAFAVWPRTRSSGEAPVALALAPTRGAEVRFTAPALDRHRPYDVKRSGAGAAEHVPLAALAELEKRGDRRTLAAAHALSGELARAEKLLRELPPSAERDSDLAALALLANRPEAALEAADQALAVAPLTAARWNRALALRELGLPASAVTELERIAAAGEAAATPDARARAAALRAPLEQRLAAFERYNAAAMAMIDRSGPPLSADDARTRPGLTRLYFLDALRASASRDEALALAPLAAELDRLSGHTGASAAVERVAAADFARRAPLAADYRKLVTFTLDPADGATLLARLDKAGDVAADIRYGALYWLGVTGERLAELDAYAAATKDPWFELLAIEQRGVRLISDGDPQRGEVLLLEAHRTCDRAAWGFRCARIANKLMLLYSARPDYPAAERWGREAARGFAADGAVGLEDDALGQIAEIQRARQQDALARATFTELAARADSGPGGCQVRRFAELGLAMLDIADAAATVSVPEPDGCQLGPSPQEIGAMVNRARMTGRPDDRARAEQWIAAGRAVGGRYTDVAELAEARLQIDAPDAGARLRALVPRFADASTTNERTWLFSTRIDEAGGREAWADVVAIAAEEVGAPPPARCALVASLDDVRGTTVVVDAAGALAGARPRFAKPAAWTGAELVPDSLRARLAGCDHVAVYARPPLHGRADLLPPSVPWSFTVRAPVAAAAAPRRELVIGDVVPPAALGLPALAPVAAPPGATALRGVDATPPRVLAALRDATYAELHVHGQVDLAVADESYLALSPGADGRWALTAADLKKAELRGAPVIVLAACRAAEVAPYLVQRWSLPDAFLAAGARAVIAPTVDVPDAEAATFFAELRERVARGEPPAKALADLRAERLRADPGSWAASVVLFE